MEIILKEDIIGLGYKNDIVKVKGVIASASARKQLAENLKQQSAKLAALKADAEKRAEALKDVQLVISAKVAATGHLYGSVGAAKVAEELAKLGIEIDRKIITMREARKVGDFEATVHFHKEVEVKVPVKVVAENQPVAAPAEEAPKEETPKAEEAPAEEQAPAAE